VRTPVIRLASMSGRRGKRTSVSVRKLRVCPGRFRTERDGLRGNPAWRRHVGFPTRPYPRSVLGRIRVRGGFSGRHLAGVAVLAATLVGCGGDDGGEKIPDDTAQEMLAKISTIGSATTQEDCDLAQSSTTELSHDVEELPGDVDPSIEEALTEMVSSVDEQLDDECPPTGTTDETTTTEETSVPTTTAPPTTTTTTTTEEEPPEEEEETTTPEQPPGEGGGGQGPKPTPPGQDDGGPPTGGLEEERRAPTEGKEKPKKAKGKAKQEKGGD